MKNRFNQFFVICVKPNEEISSWMRTADKEITSYCFSCCQINEHDQDTWLLRDIIKKEKQMTKALDKDKFNFIDETIKPAEVNLRKKKVSSNWFQMHQIDWFDFAKNNGIDHQSDFKTRVRRIINNTVSFRKLRERISSVEFGINCVLSWYFPTCSNIT